jgi:hypothetical protein
MKTAIILLYGLYTPERTDYKKYLDFLVEEINRFKYEKIILCGGITFPQIENISEAESVRRYLEPKTKSTEYILEERSINTTQNIEFAKEYISKEDNITVYCDLIRLAKVSWLVSKVFLNQELEDIYKKIGMYLVDNDIYKSFVNENIVVKGFDFEDKGKEEIIRQIYATLLEIFALYDKSLTELNTKARKEEFGLE